MTRSDGLIDPEVPKHLSKIGAYSQTEKHRSFHLLLSEEQRGRHR